MRLTFVHDGPLFYDDEGKYYEFAYHELYERYSYMADDITFLMRTKPISGERKFTRVPDMIKVVSVPNFKSPKLYFAEKKKAEQIIEQQIRMTDIAVLRSQSSIAQIALKYVKKYDIPYIVESVGCSWDSYWNHGIVGKLVAPYMFLKTKSAIAGADYVYYVTSQFLQRRYPTNGKTVSCSNVVLNESNNTTLKMRFEKLEKFAPKERLILGTAAAIDTRYKGQEHVIRVLSKLIKDGYNVEYHLAGGTAGLKSNTYLKDLAEECGVADRVVFHGSLSLEQMASFYDSLDLYIQPSKQEGLPRAVIEAMSRACPVIGTSIAGIPELIRAECLFAKNSDEAVYQAIQKVLILNLKEIARENFNKAKEYERDKLRKKRENFYDQFMLDNNLKVE